MESLNFSEFKSEDVAGRVGPASEIIVDPKSSDVSGRKIRTAQSRNCETSVSEARIKQMVSSLKNTNRFGFGDDLVMFLNNRVGLRTFFLRLRF